MSHAEHYAVRSFGFFLHFWRQRGKAPFETPPKADQIKREQIKKGV
jgi:hypothetical protein